MAKLRNLAVLGLSFAAAAVACGSNDDNEGNEVGTGGSGVGGTGGTVVIGTGSTGAGTAMDGGSIDLTPEQVTAIEGGACAGWAGEGEPLPAILQLVVDVSGSMEDDAPGSNDSKWSITHEALVESLDALSAETAVGMLLYPNRDNTGESNQPRDIADCVRTSALLPIDLLAAPGSAHRQDLVATLDDANTGGGTPTHDAYLYALEQGLIPYVSDLEKFMLLITDGQPTYSLECLGTGMVVDAVDPQPIIDEIRRARDEEGIRTFIIGSPGSEEAVESGEDTRPWLSEAAEVGGTAAVGCAVAGPNYCHMDMSQAPDFSVALRQGLAQVIGQIGQCTYAMPTPPDGQELDLTRVNLLLHSDSGAKLVLPDTVGDCTEGWQFNAEGQVVLCTATCDEVKSDLTTTVQLLFGCISGEVPEIR